MSEFNINQATPDQTINIPQEMETPEQMLTRYQIDNEKKQRCIDGLDAKIDGMRMENQMAVGYLTGSGWYLIKQGIKRLLGKE
jgi:hypothetical protein